MKINFEIAISGNLPIDIQKYSKYLKEKLRVFLNLVFSTLGEIKETVKIIVNPDIVRKRTYR